MAMSLAHALGQLNVAASGFQAVQVAEHWAPDPVPPGQAHLFVILRGDGELLAASAVTPVSAGQLFVVDGDSPVQFRAHPHSPSDASATAQGGKLVVAHGRVAATLLSGQCVFDFVSLPHCVDLGHSELFVGAIPELLRESGNAEAGSAEIVSCLVRRIVTFVLRDAWSDGTFLPIAENGRQSEVLQKIVDAMTKDPARQFTLDSLASTAGMSRTAFHNSFTKTYGKSALAVLRSIRLKKAEELLTYSDLPIKTISARLGYRSRSYFWQTFKKAYGMDPESYRNAPIRAPE